MTNELKIIKIWFSSTFWREFLWFYVVVFRVYANQCS